MVCRWLSIGPHFTVLAIAIGLIVSGGQAAWACKVVIVCHVCI